MKLKKELISGLNKIVNAIHGIKDILAVVLFGSRARGDYDEYSDYDVLIIFKNRKALRRNRMKIIKRTSKLDFPVSIVCYGLDELEKINPVFLETVFKEGRLLYVRFPFEIPTFPQLIPMSIISYDLDRLSHQDKVKLTYRLFGRKMGTKRYKGLIDELGGLRLGYGCIMVPKEASERIISLLCPFNVKYQIRTVYVPRN